MLQSYNGCDFTAHIIQELSLIWLPLVLLNGRPRHPQSQESVERSNGDMKLKLTARMRDNSPKWNIGLRIVQWSINSTYHEAVKTLYTRPLLVTIPGVDGEKKSVKTLLLRYHHPSMKTSQGVIKGCLARNEFECIKYKGINVANVPAKQPTLPEIAIVRTQSIIMWWSRP